MRQKSITVKTRHWNHVPLMVSALAFLGLAVFAMAAKSLGMVLNVTDSMPGIVYQLGHGERGSIAAFCAPIAHPSIGHGPCPDGSLPLIKRVAGVAGDLVTETDAGIEINGLPVPHSRPLDLEFKGKALPHLRGVFKLQAGEIWAAGEHPNSFDSRYYGPVKLP
jgi:conjugative transfer signal peptidase TraF